MLYVTSDDFAEEKMLEDLEGDKRPDDGEASRTQSDRELSQDVEQDKEDKTFSRQFFTISRRGHTSATAEFGSPTLVWHVAFWPKRDADPFSVEMMTADPENPKNKKIIQDDVLIKEFGEARENVVEDFNLFLKRLQARGRHPRTPDQDKAPFELRVPRDWEPKSTRRPFKVFEWEATGFTLWWPDDPPPNAANPDDPPVHAMSGRDRTKREPIPTDVRVRVLAEVSIDYSTVTFFIDAGKLWNGPPVYLNHESGVPGGNLGKRRGEIFKHVKNIKAICEERLEAVDHEGKRLIDLDLLPEPEKICGESMLQLDGYTDAATALKAAADYLYEGVWTEFCNDFGFSIKDIAGRTDVIFANFRGLVMSTCGAAVTKDNPELVRHPEPKHPSDTAHPGSRTFPRFDGGGEGYASDKVEPNAVVKAYMPFMRRFRSEADWRDWIACGIFDWRAIYITAVGAQSEFAAFDEWNYANDRPDAIPAGQLPPRRLRKDAAAKAAYSDVPTTERNDRPAPFRFLLLTKFEPDRKQVGRMVERLNSLGTRRLFALKDWSSIHNAGMWINHYGRQLDAAFSEWIRRTDGLKTETKAEIAGLDNKFWDSIKEQIDALDSPEAEAIRDTYQRTPKMARRACLKLRRLAMKRRSEIASEKPPEPSGLYSHLLLPLPKAPPGKQPENEIERWETLLKAIDDKEEEYREIIGDRDTKLAEINDEAGRELITITKGLDTVGDGAVGGLPYRIAVSRYYAKSFQDAQEFLRVGNIETWWSYEQFAKRGMEPVLRSIASVGERLDKLRTRLWTMKQDILQRSIALQTEATRDNTHRLEQIQDGIRRMVDETQALRLSIQRERLETARIEKVTAQQDLHIALGKKWELFINILLYSIPTWIGVAIAFFFGKH